MITTSKVSAGCLPGTLSSAPGTASWRHGDDGRSSFIDRFKALGISNHFTHDHIITFDDDNPAIARGLVTGHAESWRTGQALIGAMRYHDTYRHDDGEWRFQERELAFQYYLPVQEYPEAMGSTLRQRAYGDQRPADYPEALPGWRDYRNEQ